MSKDERHDHILELIALQPDGLLVSELIECLDCSPATVRRDLISLEKVGLIVQSRGRVRKSETRNASFDLRGVINGTEKEAIGKTAAALVKDGESIIIDSGTTTLALAYSLLARQRLFVVTNSIPVAYAFNGTAINTCMCGGTVNDMCLVDDDATTYLASRRVDKAFIGACGVRADGLTILSSFQHPVKRKMVEMADEVYVLVDSSKFESSGIIRFADFSDLTGLVTTKPIRNERILEEIDKHNVNLIVAGEDIE